MPRNLIIVDGPVEQPILLEKLRRAFPGMQFEEAAGAAEKPDCDFFDHVPAVLFHAGLDGVLLDVSADFAEFFGLPGRPAARGQNIRDFHANADDFRRWMDALLRDGKVRKAEAWFNRQTGKPVLIRIDARLLLDKNGARQGIEGVLHDMTERQEVELELNQAFASVDRLMQQQTVELYHANHALQDKILAHKQAEAELKKERDFVSAIMETAGALILVLDHQARIVRFNTACERLSGLSQAAVQGKTLWETVVPEEDREAVQPRYHKLLAGEFPSHFENRWRAGQGNPRLITWSNTGLLDEDGKVCYIIAVGVDVTASRHAEEKLQKVYQQNELILRAVGDGICGVDLNGNTTFVNPAAARMIGCQPEELIGKSLHQTTHHSHRDGSPYPVGECPNFAAIQDGRTHQSSDEWFWRLDGTGFPVEMVSTPIVEAGAIVGSVVSFKDITERKQAEAQLRKLSLAVEQSANAIMITDKAGTIEYVNTRFAELTGYTAEEVIGLSPAFLKSNETPPQVYERMWQTVLAGKEWHGEFHNRKKNGDLYWCLVSISPIKDGAGETTHLVAITEDISEQKSAESTINRLAFYDPLTALPNRRLFRDRVEQEVFHAKRSGKKFALLIFGLDRFKAINDSLGHGLGDQLLQAVALRVRHELSDINSLARLGGDEFALIVKEFTQVEDLARVAEKLTEALKQPFVLDGREIFMTASIGLGLFPDDSDSAEGLIGNADIALYRAKEEGRDTFQFFTPDMTHRALERLTMENSLRRALENGEFQLHYQPQAAFGAEGIMAVEALLRWNHPESGMISPARFIPIAEETGMIVPIGEWVLRTACTDLQRWRQEGLPPFKMAVNLSARQFRQSSLLALIRQVLEETGLPAEWLELELTESILMHNPDEAAATLQKLKTMGISLSIDDFGTGYSSLSYLKRFPIHKLKIDKSFVRDIISDPNDAAIAQAVINLGHSLNLTVIAEGVETGEALRFLQDQGCDELQGYYFSRPLPADRLVEFIRARSSALVRT
ncbi:MAG: EAL domain-containing protein [Sulfuricellaceae bacterium]|nr:EAL domain-containing protein [Sulfuricellaceae bacterium]